MATVTRRSRKSEIKAERKRAAAVYRTPNRHWFGADSLAMAMWWRIEMNRARDLLLSTNDPISRRRYLRRFLNDRRIYGVRVKWCRQFRNWEQMPLP